MADPEQTLTTEDYTHEEAIARIDALENAICAALTALDANQVAEAIMLLDDALDIAEEEEDGPDDEDEDDEDEDLEDD